MSELLKESEEDIINQLVSFGYGDEEDVRAAMNAVNNAKDINEIIDYLNKQFEENMQSNPTKKSKKDKVSKKSERLKLILYDAIISNKYLLYGYIRDFERVYKTIKIPTEILKILLIYFVDDKFINNKINNCSLNDYLNNNIGSLGKGSFGFVSLVKNPNTKKTFALKKLNINKMIKLEQQRQIRNERNILSLLYKNSSFCVKLYGTFKDKFNIYLLMEAILGGELFTLLRWNKRFRETQAKFYAANVILAFEEIHNFQCVYRNLKPEDMLIDKNGYLKLCDFGFAKQINSCSTLCGTPEYLPPEVIKGEYQSFSVDYWCLGIFIYEMVVGYTPFRDDETSKMYEKILKNDVEFASNVEEKRNPFDVMAGIYDKDEKDKNYVELHITNNVKNLIKGLLKRNPLKRLGHEDGNGNHNIKEIMNHEWFNDLNWNDIRQQKITPSWIPNIENEEDISSYDKYNDEDDNHGFGDNHDDPFMYEWCQDF